MKISAVIPVWNGREYLGSLLDTIAAQTVPIDELVVVDNGSTDGAGDLARNRGAKVVRFEKNHGFAAAVNRGVSESRGEIVAILNSDVELEKDWTELLARAVENPSVYFAAGQILSRNEPEIDGCWDLVSRAGMPWRAGSGALAGHPLFRESRRIQMASFTAILLRRELWTLVGPLDERFESYLEDVDFGLRCIGAGCEGAYVANAVCIHHGSAALGRWNRESVRRMSRNQVFLVRKHIAANWWTLLIGQGLWGLLAFRHGAGFAWIQGKLEGWRRHGEFQLKAVNVRHLEQEIFTVQACVGFDAYWRWYARLTGQNDTGSGRE